MELVSSVVSQLRCSKCGDFSLLFTVDNLNQKGCASTLRLLVYWKHFFAHQKSKERALKLIGAWHENY